MWFLFASSLGLQSKARYLKALQALLYEIKEWLCSYKQPKFLFNDQVLNRSQT